jgi:hypothetical protein
MWILQTRALDNDTMIFRMAAGAIKTVGRASRADFIVDAAMIASTSKIFRARTGPSSTTSASTAPALPRAIACA